MKKYYAVTSCFYDGKSTAAITDMIEGSEKPADEFHETRRCDVYIDWFESKKEALEHIKKTINA